MSKKDRIRRRKKQKRKRIAVLVVQIVVLIFLAVVLIFAIRGTQLLGLINRVETNSDNIKTSSEANAQYNTSSSTTSESETQTDTNQYTGYDVIALVGLDTRGDISDDDYSENSDTMILCVIDHNTKSIRLCSVYRDTYLNVGKDYYGDPDYYTKANAAYNLGGPEQFLSMINLNLDLNVTQFVTVDFAVLTECIDRLGGLDIAMTREELIHVNNYNVETAAEAGVEYEALEVPDDPNFDGVVLRTFHCNGSQAVSYARIRYTAGNDFRRASRQREVLSLIKDKASQADVFTLNSVLEAVLPGVKTNMDAASMISLALNIVSYDMNDGNMSAFPSVKACDETIMNGEYVVPVTLEYNVQKLHEFLFPNEAYTPSYTVMQYSEKIIEDSSLTSDYIDYYASLDDEAALTGITEEEYLAQQGQS